MFLQIKVFALCLFMILSWIHLSSQCEPNVAGSCCDLPILQSSGSTEDNLLSDVSMGTAVYSAYDVDSDNVEIYKSKNGTQTLVSTNNLVSNSSPAIYNDRIVWHGREENKAHQLYQSQGGSITQIVTSYASARYPKFVNGELYFSGERTSSPLRYDLVKISGDSEIIISPTNSGFIGDPKVINGVIYFDYSDTDSKRHIAKYENGVTSVVVSDVPGLSSNAFLVGSKIVYKVFNANDFRDEIWVSDNGVKTNLTQDTMIDRIDVIEQTSTGVIWKEQGLSLSRKIWKYDGITISQVTPPVGLTATRFYAQIEDISFYYNTSSKKFYKVEDGMKTLLADNSHRQPQRLRMEGNTLFYTADDLSFEEQVYSISCGGSCPDDITLSKITETAYAANNSITTSDTISSGAQVLLSAGTEVSLLPKFAVLPTGQLSIIIQSCDDFNSN